MRAMPYRVASADSVTYEPVVVTMNRREYPTNEPLRDWDYLTAVSLHASVTVSASRFLGSAHLNSLTGVSVYLQADCPSTGWRALALQPAGSDEVTQLTLDIPPGLVAEQVEVQQGVVLTQDLPPRGTSARNRGSRLHEGPKSTVQLEGAGSGMPVEAFDFAGSAYPEFAPWFVRFTAESLTDPYLSSVRLYVNAGHPRADEMLAGRDRALISAMTLDVVLQLLLQVSHWDAQARPVGHEEGSLGAVLEAFCEQYLQMSLAGALEAMESDLSVTVARLQSGTRYLEVRWND